jgi:nicotinate-nucleotide adenylyltransferase
MRDTMPEASARTHGGGPRIAFFGGSFDPPHLGHLAVARAARTALALDTVLFAPVGAQPLKQHGSTASFEDRAELTRLAIAGEPGFAVTLADAPKPSGAPNYTIDTLLSLRAELPPDAVLFCLMGADAFFGLRQWHRSTEIPFVATLIVASRPGQPLELVPSDLKAALPVGLMIEPAPVADELSSGVEVRRYLLKNPQGQKTGLYLLPGLDVEISASQVRDQIRQELRAVDDPFTVEHQLLPQAVIEAIRARGLYR